MLVPTGVDNKRSGMSLRKVNNILELIGGTPWCASTA